MIANEVSILQKELNKIKGMKSDMRKKQKIELYQVKILELLIREKTQIIQNQRLSNLLKNKEKYLKDVQLKLASKQEKYQILEEDHRSLAMDYELQKSENKEKTSQNNKIIAEFEVFKQASSKELNVKDEQIKTKNEEITNSKQKILEKEQIIKNLQKMNEELTKNIAQKDNQLKLLSNEYKKGQKELESLIEQNKSSQNQINLLKQKLKEMNITLNQHKVEEQQKLMQIQSQSKNSLTLTNDRIRQLSKQNTALKNLKQQLTSQVDQLQKQNENLARNAKLNEKELKKSKQQLTQYKGRCAQNDQQIESLTKKLKTAEAALKVSKREIQDLKESLSSAQESTGDWASKIKKYEANAKTLKDKISELQNQILQIKSDYDQAINEKQSIQKTVLELTYFSEKLKKEKEVLLQENRELEEAKILLKSQKENNMTILINQKSILMKSNEKLLQMLELKEKTIKKIIDGDLSNFEVQTDLHGGQFMAKIIKKYGKEKLIDPKERLKILANEIN